MVVLGLGEPRNCLCDCGDGPMWITASLLLLVDSIFPFATRSSLQKKKATRRTNSDNLFVTTPSRYASRDDELVLSWSIIYHRHRLRRDYRGTVGPGAGVCERRQDGTSFVFYSTCPTLLIFYSTTCRKRHLKCDELKPICGLCKKAKKTCSYAQQIPTTPSTVSRGRQEKRTESVSHEDEEIVTCTPAQLHTIHHDEDVADLTQTTPPAHNPEPQEYATPHIFSWDHIANDEHEAVIGEDTLQQQQEHHSHQHHPQQSLDQLAAIVAADRDNSSTSSILHNNNFSANTAQSLSTSVSVTSPGPTVNAATIRWFGLLAHDAARSTPEISTVFDHTTNGNTNGTENDYRKFRNFFFARAEEENVDVSSLTPLERATRIVDQQQPSLLGVEGEDSNAHVHAHPFEEQLWQSEKSIQLLSREYLLFEHFVRRVSQWVCLP